GTLERPIQGMRLIPFDGSVGTTPMPVVTMTNPDDGDRFTAPATVNITASASIGEGTIAKVEFFNGPTKIGEDTASPYAFTWSNVPAGDYTIIAKAIDASGSTATTSVEISVASGGASA